MGKHVLAVQPSGPQLTSDESRDYWERRHAEEGSLSSGGHIGFGEATNAMFYAVRTARLVEALGPRANPAIPLRVLDAGCGKGFFSRSLASFGHLVDGIDTSATAIRSCQAQASTNDHYAVAPLAQWSPPYLYDAVVCIDVLYHLMDDDEWSASVYNLASLVRLGGILGLVDHDHDEDRVWQNYQKTRSSRRYAELFDAYGFQERRFVRNAFRRDPSGMHVAVRVS